MIPAFDFICFVFFTVTARIRFVYWATVAVIYFLNSARSRLLDDDMAGQSVALDMDALAQHSQLTVILFFLNYPKF